MAASTTERFNVHAVELPQTGFEKGRRGSIRMTSPTTRTATPTEQKREELPRAASYTYLPTAKTDHLGNTSVADVTVFPDANYAASEPREVPNTSPSDTSPPNSSGWNTPDDQAPTIAPPRARDITAQLKKLPNTRHDTPTQSMRSSTESSGQNVTTGATLHPSIKKSFSVRFSRRSWISMASSTPSRSPSPRKKDVPTRVDSIGADLGQPSDGSAEGRRKSLISRRLTTKSTKDSKEKQDNQQSSEELESEKSIMKKGQFLRRKSVSRATALVSNATPRDSIASQAESTIPAVPALPKSFSTDRLVPAVRSMSSPSDRAAPVPKLISREKVHSSGPLSLGRKKDELWGVFRALDADFSKFSSKSSALKANVVRNSLIPFLRIYAAHPSSKTLRPEDLDRRSNILNKWWTGLIELLYGRNNQSISGTDRPIILDGVLGIMERPEWRLYPSAFCSLNERVHGTLASGNRSHASLVSSSSDFLADSVHHNVRNIFIQNLTSQMAFVVDKMSLRNASASLVNFCGKACAYAFMFVPGMADILVRLWELPMDIMRRALQENGIGRFDKLPDSANHLLENFPPALQQLGFTSLTKYMRKLRTPPPLPPGANHIEWWGHWLERWSGRESDLFYVFVKQFHILMTDFLPSNTTKLERLAVPGLLPIHAQILSNLDATIHRDINQVQQDSALAGPLATFDELLGDPDAMASALPVPPINATRLMAENRLIMLVRDFLSDGTADHPIARFIFAQSFSALLQAAARATSMFDHSACYTLLDFLEESLVILVRFEHLQEAETCLIDTQFWQTVYRKMMDSENTMTEIRLYAFLYTLWNTVICDSGRKMGMCLDLLLDPEIFESRFNHWCPMVRAYYMRLLCWRLARHDDDEDGVELDLLETMQERLLGTWSYYLFNRERAEQGNVLRPATNPCYPAPGRRLLIVRTDNQINNAGSLLTFEGLVRDSPSQMAKPAWKRTGSTGILDGLGSRPESSSSTVDSEPESPQRGIAGFLRKMMGGGKSTSQSREAKAGSPAVDVTGGRAATDDDQGRTGKDTQQVQHRSLSFKFSLEFHPNAKPLPPMRLFPPRLPPPAQKYLQANSKKPLATGSTMRPMQPVGESIARARYSGRALAEWTMVVGECHSFFERRKNEGAPSNKYVETPTLGVEVVKRLL